MAYRYGNSIQRETPAVFYLLVINVLVYMAQRLITGFNVTEWGALHYFKSPGFRPVQFITNIFMHDPDNFFHLAFNMFTLWMFGSILEKFWGSQKFLNFYMICGIGASIIIELSIPFSGQQLIKSLGELPGQPGYAADLETYKMQYEALGASGAIMGLLAAFAYLFPNTEMMMIFIPIPIKAKYFIPLYMLIELFQGVHQFQGDNVGHFAHLGGALIGFLLVLFWNKSDRKTFY